MSGKEFLFKVLLCGDGAVGKTSIREQYMGSGFSGDYMKTIGADFASQRMEREGHKITLQIFDLAGQDAYITARKSFYKGGQAAFLIFDLQDPDSLYNLKTWIEDCIENSGGSIGTFVILGNKADLIQTRQVSNNMAIEYSRQLSAQTGLTFVFLETSAKSGLNIGLAFDIVTNRMLTKFNVDIDFTLPEGVQLISPSDANSQTATIAHSAPDTQTTSTPDSGEVLTRLDALDERIAKLEDRFNKLATIVKSLVKK